MRKLLRRCKRFLYAIVLKPHKVLEAFVYLVKKKFLKFVLDRQKVEGEFVFLTAADSSHYKTVKQFLRSFFKYEDKSKIIFYDLGLSDKESQRLLEEFPEVIYKKFNFSEYPDYFDLKKKLGGYAWKPVIFWKTLNEFKCKLIWMDAGTLITCSLDNLKKYIVLKGFFWNYSPGTIEDWTHEKTLSYLNVPQHFYKKRNLASGVVAVDYNHKEAVEVARDWKDCAMNEECISPKGSDKTNHRQDQAALTIIAHKRGLVRGLKLTKTGFLVQQDID